MALAGGVMIANFVAFADQTGNDPPQEILRTAIRDARFQAASLRQIATLRYDDETGSLVVDPGERFPLGPDFGKDGSGEIRFYVVPPAEGLGSFPEPERTQLQTKAIRFAPDRSSSPFVAEIDMGRGTPERLVFDPFSSIVRTPK